MGAMRALKTCWLIRDLWFGGGKAWLCSVDRMHM